ncbi:SPW repeat domain-containing protein [Bradyrhizobium sp. B120]|uniref:SPW repeat domain-containing protein n=1 Tax=Bradyrhizobium sp. B120 TaxID=3410088 RepID=UPI003B983CC8
MQITQQANQPSTRFDPRFVTKTLHAYLDYPVAASLIALPFVLGLGGSNASAKWIAVVTGVAAIVLTFFTDHGTGVIRIIPFSFHVAVDALVGIIFVTVPFVLGFTGLDAWYYWANGGALLAVLCLQKSDAMPMRTASA